MILFKDATIAMEIFDKIGKEVEVQLKNKINENTNHISYIKTKILKQMVYGDVELAVAELISIQLIEKFNKTV